VGRERRSDRNLSENREIQIFGLYNPNDVSDESWDIRHALRPETSPKLRENPLGDFAMHIIRLRIWDSSPGASARARAHRICNDYEGITLCAKGRLPRKENIISLQVKAFSFWMVHKISSPRKYVYRCTDVNAPLSKRRPKKQNFPSQFTYKF